MTRRHVFQSAAATARHDAPRENAAPVVAAPRARVESVDALRGIIMMVMALDHVRDYFGDLSASPTNLATASTGLFLTRWVTHICAPVFFLMAGTGAYLALRRRSTSELSRFLVTRGLWLVVLEIVVLRFAMQFNVDYQVTLLTVLWALGWSMVVLGALVHLPTRLVAAFGIVLILVHNLLDGINAGTLGALGPLWSVLHAPGFLLNTPDHVVFVAYPLVPWIGVTAAGYGLGQLYDLGAERRRVMLAWLGVGMIAAFIILRAMNGYGDPSRWSAQESPLRTLLSFINTTKYPPSLLFLLMTLGPALLLLRALDGQRTIPPWLQPAVIIGRVPMFFFLLHFVLIHLLAVAASAVRLGDASGMFQSASLDKFPITQPPGWPMGLPAVYMIWTAVVVLMYRPCRWFAEVRRRRTDWWLSYL